MRTGKWFVMCAVVAGMCIAAYPAGARGQESPASNLPNVGSLNPYDFAATVSWAMEACRRVYSPMTPEQTKAFEKAWGPAFGYPCPALVDYLNKLIPLLRQYLALHGAMQEAALQFDEAWREALVLKEYKSAEGVEEALALAYQAKCQLVHLGNRREDVARRIKALGDSPNPRLCRTNRRQLHDESVMTATEGTKPLSPEEAARQEAQAGTRQERIDLHKGNIQISELNIAKWQKEMATATNMDLRETLLRAILQAKSNCYSEADRIREVGTGEFVHTRTPIDEYHSVKFVEECRTAMAADAQILRYAQVTQRLIALAAPDHRDQLQSLVSRHTGNAKAWGDVATMRKLSRIVFEKVQGHWEGQSARSLEQATIANRNLQYAQTLKTTAEAEMFAATMGLSSMGVAGAGWVMPTFDGAVGYTEADGPKSARIYNAIEKSQAWTDTAGRVASEAMAGYEKGGWLSGKTGWVGAGGRADEAFALVKGVEYTVATLWGVPPQVKRPTVQAAFDHVGHKQAIDDGRRLVDDYQQSYREYQTAMSLESSGEEAIAMEAALRQKAAGIHATYEARLYLKSVGNNPKFAEMITDFNQRLGQIHSETLTRFRQMVIEQAFDNVGEMVFQKFRNSTVAGTVGMDYDIGL
ncbi:MAG: hypothetical protein WCK05_07595, partial [Planctomycetota bacterium]